MSIDGVAEQNKTNLTTESRVSYSKGPYKSVWFVHMGNSGFDVTVTADNKTGNVEESRLDFTPDGASKPITGEELRHGKIFCNALYSFVSDWKERRLNGKSRTPLPDIHILTGSTNPQMFAFRLKLLGPEIFKSDLSDPDEYGNKEFSLDLEKLSSDVEVLNRLKKIGQARQQ